MSISSTAQTRFLKLLVTSLLKALQHARFLHAADLAEIMSNNAEKVLNLPGRLPFFPSKVTELERVKALIQKLHPLACGTELIRLGPDGDGGYLVPNDLAGIQACFSPGVSNIAGFEIDCAKLGMDVYMADASIEQPPSQHPRFQFARKFVGATTQDNFVSLEDWVATSAGDSQSDLLLQMDIEGYEYETLLAAPQHVLERFRIMVIEFHYLDYLFSEPVFPLYARVFEKLLKTHTCVHIHPNNYCSPMMVKDLEMLQMAEFTFLRSDRIASASYRQTFPHPLDQDNTDRAALHLPKSFYRQTCA